MDAEGFSREEIGRFRGEFALNQLGIYLNHAAVSPLPRRARVRMEVALEEAAREADGAWGRRLAEIERVREMAAGLIGAAADRVALVPNTSTGLSLVAEGLAWHAGDNVVGCTMEFPANVYPWNGLGHHGVEYRPLDERQGRIEIDDIEQAVDERTRVVALSWVQFASGYRLDLEAVSAICHRHDALLVVDAIQGLGALTLDVGVSGVDVMVAGAHKWLLAPEGIGMCYFSERASSLVRPVIRGWLSVEEPFAPATGPPVFRDGASRFEAGTANVFGIYGLGGSLDLLAEAGPARIEQRVLSLADHVALGLEDLGFHLEGGRLPEEKSGIVGAVPPSGKKAEAIVGALDERGVRLSARAGKVRVAPHFYVTHQEIDGFLEATEEALWQQ